MAGPAALAALAALAESAGWDAFLLEDYLCYRGLPTYDPRVCLAAIAVATTRIRLGTTVTPLPRQPWELAAQIPVIRSWEWCRGHGLPDPKPSRVAASWPAAPLPQLFTATATTDRDKPDEKSPVSVKWARGNTGQARTPPDDGSTAVEPPLRHDHEGCGPSIRGQAAV
jgi:hypothetical protein